MIQNESNANNYGTITPTEEYRLSVLFFNNGTAYRRDVATSGYNNYSVSQKKRLLYVKANTKK